MYVRENTHGQFFLVFSDEGELMDFLDYNPDFQGFPMACCGGYMNALELCHPNR